MNPPLPLYHPEPRRLWPLRWLLPSNRVGRYALALAVWTLLGVLDGVETYYKAPETFKAMSWGESLGMGLMLWYGWMLVAFAVFALVRRYPLDVPDWPRRVAAYVAVAVGFTFAKFLIDWPIISYGYGSRMMPFDFYLASSLRFYAFRYYLIVWGLVGVGHALTYFRQSREREGRARLLEARLTEVQMQLLRVQLNPHFLFNTLNAISALIHRDVEVADRMIARLGELLRLSLDHFAADEVSLEQELEFLNKYLEIEQERYGARLRVREQVEPGLGSARVPYLLLQPLVENALKHGVGRAKGAGRITVRAVRSGGRLRLEVEDDGAGLAPGHRPGVGLSNTRARLRQLYPADHAFALTPGSAGGTLAAVEIPLRLDDPDPDPAPGLDAGRPLPVPAD